jgi:hypothetical protein
MTDLRRCPKCGRGNAAGRPGRALSAVHRSRQRLAAGDTLHADESLQVYRHRLPTALQIFSACRRRRLFRELLSRPFVARKPARCRRSGHSAGGPRPLNRDALPVPASGRPRWLAGRFSFFVKAQRRLGPGAMRSAFRRHLCPNRLKAGRQTPEGPRPVSRTVTKAWCGTKRR